MKSKRNANPARTAYIVIGILILLLLAYSVLNFTHAPASGYNVLLQLTDPPHVPNGTQSLNITYSGLQVHVIGKSAGWINSAETGSVNLLSIINLSKTLGSVTVPSNDIINLFRFNITGSSIVINGTRYNVTVPSKEVLVNVIGRINSTGSMLVELSPTVITIITNDSTPVFVLVPSARAIIFPGIKAGAEHTGSVVHLNSSESEELNRTRPNISITSAAISTTANVTHILITLKNSGNETATLKHVLIFGNETMTASINITDGPPRNNIRQMPSPMGALISGVRSGNITLNESDLWNAVNAFREGRHVNISNLEDTLGNLTHNLPAIAALHINATIAKKIINATVVERKIEVEQTHFRVVNFLVEKNASLELPRADTASIAGSLWGIGYNLSAGQSITLTFSGKMSVANGRVFLSFVPGTIYAVRITGTRGAEAKANVTAS